MNEADTCRRLITPKIQAAGWDNDPHSIADPAFDGELQFTLPDVSRHRGIPPISQRGNVNETIHKFGGADQLRNAVNQLQSLLYAA